MKRFFLTIIKIFFLSAGALTAILAGLFLYTTWLVSDLPAKLADFKDCENIVSSENNSIVSNPTWRTQAVFAVEPNFDSYLANLLASRFGIRGKTVEWHLKWFVLTALLKITRADVERVDALLRAAPFVLDQNGINCASISLFGQNYQSLSVAQFATLVGLIKGPSNYSPTKRPEAALKRRNDVLLILRKENLIGVYDLSKALQEKLI